MTIQQAIEKTTAGAHLTRAEARMVMQLLLSGAVLDDHIVELLAALRDKGERAEELEGFAEVMRAHAAEALRAVGVELDHISHREPLLDTCGTGGDGHGTFNVSTAAALVAAAAGVRVAKHGNRSISSRCGSADVLEALGVVIDLPPEATARLAAETGIAFLFAPLYHPSFRHASVARSQLGVPTVFNFLGPVSNPARPGAQAVGVSDPRMGEVIAGVLAGRGVSALVFHGDDGLDELTTTTTSTVWVVHGGAVDRAVFDPAVLGLGRARPEDLRGGDREHNAAVARAFLAGEGGPVRDTVLLNAAAALAALAGVPGAGALDKALAEGYARAAAAVDSGAALGLLDRWVAASRELAQSDS